MKPIACIKICKNVAQCEHGCVGYEPMEGTMEEIKPAEEVIRIAVSMHPSDLAKLDRMVRQYKQRSRSMLVRELIRITPEVKDVPEVRP